jgi:hypothetical protein
MIWKISPLLAVLLLFVSTPPGRAQVEKSVFKLGLISQEKEQDQRHESERERRLRIEVLNAATDAFVATRRFTMVERNQLDAIFTEKSLQEFIGGQVNNKLTDVLGLDLVGVVGYTMENSKTPQGQMMTKCIIDVRLLDVKTASILATLSSERPTLMPVSTPREAGESLYKNIRESFPPIGYVVSVSGKEIVVDLGTEAGLKDGDTLEIVQEGEQIIHPVTGKVLSAPMKVVGELKVVAASPQISTCKLKSKGAPAVASLVRLQKTDTRVLKWMNKIPGIKNVVQSQSGEVQQ